ncbi:bifunctional phosphopantothenoylcysteine decarboxylase/phosphopantothenate--cysteine ligase CoaBC [Miltoncostaea marina]|uniref:bifunctional phosphopantothenoylcysteine decarboxylase/phosphopantothenate--cysteine ligase CoaBC n=1 Tax=Miltoncostaea marina TaxID=2843215 RepID=UPI001C3CEDA7|nr:bifunctional phosphopantothenoylcysteine decarboxylase/phosphopantothenate--cysteine ligase CoaBC [Miltoncostaea marina]
MAEVLLGVSGGIAAYKAIDVMRILQRRGHAVTVVMTRSAQRFVGPATFAALSGRPVGTDMFGAERSPGYGHLDLARRADLLLVAPASANTLAHMAAGMAGGLLGAVHLAFDGPVLVAPAMNTRMYLHAATADNLALLRDRGVGVVEPGTGLLADGDVGVGRLAEPGDIADAVEARLAGAGTLAGRRVVVSAGGTREPIDAVRYVGNRSSGRMGWAIAAAARRRGAEVTVLASNVELPREPGVRYVEAPTAADLHRATLDAFAGCDVLVMAAAVADFRPGASRAGKIDKSAQGSFAIELEPTTDILGDLAPRRAQQVVVGFAAEHGAAGLERARAKRVRKRLDLIVHNDVSVDGIGFGSAQNEITIIGADGEETLPRMSKEACAERILDAVVPLLPA